MIEMYLKWTNLLFNAEQLWFLINLRNDKTNNKWDGKGTWNKEGKEMKV
jgi:hypothetical protein